MMKRFLIITVFLISIAKISAQKYYKPSERDAIIVGYQASFEAKDKTENWEPTTTHIIEIVFSRIKDNGGRHPSSMNYYAGSNFILNWEKLIVAPNVGINLSANAMIIGLELQLYTDFSHISPRLMPFIGIGTNGFRLFTGYSFRLAKSDCFPINTLNVGLSVPLYLNKKND